MNFDKICAYQKSNRVYDDLWKYSAFARNDPEHRNKNGKVSGNDGSCEYV